MRQRSKQDNLNTAMHLVAMAITHIEQNKRSGINADAVTSVLRLAVATGSGRTLNQVGCPAPLCCGCCRYLVWKVCDDFEPSD